MLKAAPSQEQSEYQAVMYAALGFSPNFNSNYCILTYICTYACTYIHTVLIMCFNFPSCLFLQCVHVHVHMYVCMYVQYVLVLNVIHSECECPQTCGDRGVDLKLMMFEMLLMIFWYNVPHVRMCIHMYVCV